MDNHVAAWLEIQKSELVGLAEDLVRETRLEVLTGDDLKKWEEKQRKKRDGAQVPKLEPTKPAVSTSQIRNLLAAAQNGSSLGILTNFLRYQFGRGRGAWEHEDSFHKLEEIFTKDLPQRCKKIPITLKPEQSLDAEARIAAQFLGFLSREYTYRRHVYEEDWYRAHPEVARKNQ